MLASIGHFFAAHAIVMLMLSVGLRTDRSLLRELYGRRRVLARALLVIWIGVPLLALLVIYALHLTPIAAVTLMVMAICPGIPLVLFKSKHAHGDPTTSLLILMATALTAFVMVPLWAAILSRFTPLELALRPRTIADLLLPLIIVPFAVGRLTNELAPRIAPMLAKIATVLFGVGLVIIVISLVAKRVPQFSELTARDILGALLIPAGAAVLGYIAGAARPANRVSVAYAAALGNPILAITALAHTQHDQQFKAVPIVVAFVVLRALALVPFSLWLKHRHHDDAAHPPTPDDLAHAH